MLELFVYQVNIIQILVVITFVISIFCVDFKKTYHKLLLVILGCSLLNELTTTFFMIYNIDYGFLYSVSAIIHNCLWLILLHNLVKGSRLLEYIILIYLCFGLVNLFIFEGTGYFNSYTFVLGAFLYLSIFIIVSFNELKKENFQFFYSNNYLLLFAPVLFFLGFSFYFGFKNSELGKILIFKNIELYSFIGYFVNVVYYILINIYVFREKKLKNAR